MSEKSSSVSSAIEPKIQEPEPYKISQISPENAQQETRGWQVEVNGQEITEPINQARLVNQKMGIEVQYGQRPEGYDGVVIKEAGGSVTIPYMINPDDGEVYVGVVKEYRPTMGGYTYNVPRGFMDAADQSRLETAMREMNEETGFKPLAERLVQLADNLNANSAYFDTTPDPADSSKPQGVSVFAVRIEPNELIKVQDEKGQTTYAFPPRLKEIAQDNENIEKIVGSRFIKLGEAVKGPDMFTSAAAGQLMAALFAGELPYVQRADKAS